MSYRIDRYLQHAMASRASDVHFSSDEPVRMRIDGDLVIAENGSLSSEEIQTIFSEILTPDEQDKLLKQKNLDRSHSVPGIGNFRLNIFFTRKGMAGVVRAIPSKIPTMVDLGLPDAVQSLTEHPKGLILVTGPTGSGKSTTLAAMIHHINMTYPYHVLTVEDPVEFVHQCNQSLVNQREIGNTCNSFADALKFALREDPDVILIGEMRDLETISLALTAAETGHLVFGTLHTRGAAASIDRIIDSFPANQQAMIRAMLAESLVAVISQVLLKRKDGKGRVAAYEILVVNHAISNLIREGKTFQIPSVIQTARREGMILMSQHIRELINSGVVSEEEGAHYLEDGGAKTKPPTKPATAPTKPAPKQGFTPKLLEKEPITPAGATKIVTGGAPRPATATTATPGAQRPAAAGAPPPMARPGAPSAPAARAPMPGAAVPSPATAARPQTAAKPQPPAAPTPAAAKPPEENTGTLEVDVGDLGAGEEGVLEVTLPEDGLQEVAETTGSHQISKLLNSNPPSKNPPPNPNPLKKTG